MKGLGWLEVHSGHLGGLGRDSPQKRGIGIGLKPDILPAAREGPTSCLPSALLHQFEFNAIWKACAWLLALMLKN